MGMTIDEAKEHLSQYIGDNRVDYDDLDAIEVAVNVIQKYQKIKQIIETDRYQPANTYVCGGVWLTDEKRVSAIREVLKDGNNN